jgi:hypothetical protein
VRPTLAGQALLLPLSAVLHPLTQRPQLQVQTRMRCDPLLPQVLH